MYLFINNTKLLFDICTKILQILLDNIRPFGSRSRVIASASTFTPVSNPAVAPKKRDVALGQGATNSVDALPGIDSRNIVDRGVEQSQVVDKGNALFNSFVGVNKIPLGAITIEDSVGVGGFGKVYRGNWRERPVALKRVGLEYTDGGVVQRFQWAEDLSWEMARLATVEHPNVAQFYGIYQEQKEGYTYLVIEFCGGGELYKKLKKEGAKISWAKRWQWALEMCEGLAYLHSQGILHRDLKADNVLLDRNDRIKLVDLGTAQVDELLQEAESQSVAEGVHAIGFVAPENVNDLKLSTKATDVYALGLVLWQVATNGGIPRQWKGIEDFYEREKIPDDCPEGFKQLILDCWQMDPDKRPSTQELVSRLQALGPELNPKHHVLVKACQALEKIIHPKRKEGLAYIAPFVTANTLKESVENYWDKWQSLEDDKTGSNPPLKLEDAFLNFIKTPGCSTLLLLGEGGLGKTLTTYLWADRLLAAWWTYIKYPALQRFHIRPPYFPILIRPTLSKWEFSSLQGAFSNILKRYGVNSIPLLVFVDGYDEVQMGEKVSANLADYLGLSEYPNAKLIVTSRPNTVDAAQLHERFSFEGKLQTYHFLPFSNGQLIEYLKAQLYWGKQTEAQYKKILQDSKSVREILRNPFVLYLLKQSWETLSQEPLDMLTRWKIYEGFVKHSITIHASLLAPELQGTLADPYLNLVDSFQPFARDVAFSACQNGNITLSLQEAVAKLKSPWIKIEELVEKAARKQFAKREETLSKADEEEKSQKRRRALINEADFIAIMQMRRKQFENDLPVKIRNDGYEFSHKSLFEYFVAKKLLQFCDKEACLVLAKDLLSLTSKLKDSVFDFGVLLFFHECWKEELEKRLTIPSMLKIYNKDENSKRALTNIAILFTAVGQVLEHKLAKYDAAMEYYQESLAISQKVFGKDHPSVATSYNNIGLVLDNQGKYEEALKYYFKSLAIREKVLGKDHPHVVDPYKNIAAALEAQGQHAQAKEYRLKASDIERKMKKK